MESQSKTELMNMNNRFDPECRQFQFEYCKTLDAFPTAIGSSIRLGMESRRKRNNDRPSLGEITPFLVSDMLSIPLDSEAMSLMMAWMDLYVYSVLFDDILDGVADDTAQALSISIPILLTRGVTGITKGVPALDSYQVNRIIGEICEAVLLESVRREHGFTGESTMRVRESGRKNNLVKLAVLILLAKAGQEERCAGWDESVNNLTSGIQLLDDTADWWEDWEGGQVTLPLSLALQRSGRSKGSVRNRTELWAILIQTGSIVDCIEIATNTINCVIEAIDSAESQVSKWLSAILQQHGGFMQRAKAIKSKMDMCVESSDRELVLDMPTRRALVALDEELRIIANFT